MIAGVVGEANRPEPIPLPKIRSANTQNEKSTGSSISPVKQHAASSRPAVANGRGPYRSDKVPEIGPAISKPAVSSRRQISAHSGVSAKSYPCNARQIPVRQTTTMHFNPPPAIEPIKLAHPPAAS